MTFHISFYPRFFFFFYLCLLFHLVERLRDIRPTIQCHTYYCNDNKFKNRQRTHERTAKQFRMENGGKTNRMRQCRIDEMADCDFDVFRSNFIFIFFFASLLLLTCFAVSYCGGEYDCLNRVWSRVHILPIRKRPQLFMFVRFESIVELPAHNNERQKTCGKKME